VAGYEVKTISVDGQTSALGSAGPFTLTRPGTLPASAIASGG
jgi:hypothetical protein